MVEQLKNSGLRTEIDLRNEKINYKVREHSLLKTPVLIALGKREIEDRTVSIRRLGKKGQEIVLLTDAISILAKQSQTHS